MTAQILFKIKNPFLLFSILHYFEINKSNVVDNQKQKTKLILKLQTHKLLTTVKRIKKRPIQNRSLKYFFLN
jgi:hypothetical protein